MPSLLLEQLELHCLREGGATAVCESGPQGMTRQLTWKQLISAATALANGLRSRLAPGSVVLLIAPNRIEYLIAFHGCLLADMTVFPLSPQLTPSEWREAARRSNAAVCIGDAAALAALKEHVSHQVPLESLLTRSKEMLGRHDGTGAMLLQSSGTTGLPKIVRRSLAALIAVGDNCRTAVGLRADDHMLTVIPVCHSYGIDHAVMAAALAGCTVELCNGFDVQHVRRRLLSGEPTVFPAVPFIFEALSQAAGQQAPLTSLRRAYSAGSTLPPRIFEGFYKAFRVPIGQVYGSTEFGSVTFNDPLIEPFDPASAGRAMNGVALRAVAREAQRMNESLAVGDEGQIAVAGPSMFSEYLDQTELPFVDGLFPSGDLGRIDGHGRLTITGRLKLLIDVGGLKVNPLEVEDVLAQLPSVRQVVVIGVAVSETINRVKAVVVWRDGGGSVEELLAFARARLAPYKVPRIVEERESLPCTPTGKVLRQAVMTG